MNKLKIVKGVVGIMTFMLVFGSLMLLTMIYKKSQTPSAAYTEIALEQPAGSGIAGITAVKDELAILVKGGGEPDRIIIYNPQTKQKTSALNL